MNATRQSMKAMTLDFPNAASGWRISIVRRQARSFAFDAAHAALLAGANGKLVINIV